MEKHMEAYLMEQQPLLRQLICSLCAIPAPSHQERQRAEFLYRWLTERGAKDVRLDKVNNVIWPLCDVGIGPVTVFMAHTDTVFPERETMILREDGGRYYCPGVTDDTAQLAVLLVSGLYFLNRVPRENLVIVANACEEGLGNLKGSRAVVEHYGSRLKQLIAVDGTCLHKIVGKAVGSRRYRVTVRTQGGHSFGDFGRENAIHRLSELICRLYAITVPKVRDSCTTFNVGEISGGTSVNTIAQEASMLYEFRSDSAVCLEQMEQLFRRQVMQTKTENVSVEIETVGERPCAAGVDPLAQQQLICRTAAVIRQITGREAVVCSGSTDCNAALGAGIPAVCIGGCVGGECHTRQEYLELDSLESGCRLVMTLLAEYFF